jgi:formylglycine-generating enzyme required for sulfatase activity
VRAASSFFALLPYLLCATGSLLPVQVWADDKEKFTPYTEHVPKTLVKFDMVPIPVGKFDFSIGGKTKKEIELKRFWIAKTECTWDQFETFYLQLDLPQNQRSFARIKTRPSAPYEDPSRDFGRSGYPVISITAYSAEMFCKWLSEKTGRKYRLPTEAEWEYACRAGVEELDKDDLLSMGWLNENAENKTQPAAKKKPNGFGLFDMLGNAGEWCTPLEGKVPVLRGGWYATKIDELYSGTRSPFDKAWQIRDAQVPPSKWWLSDAPFAGFRVVREE